MTASPNQSGISQADLEAAIAAGVVERDQANRLTEFVNTRAVASGQADEENFRLISGFNDIFVTIGLALFIGALSYLTAGFSVAISAAAIAVVAWGLAEIFTKRKRLALPSIALLAVYAVAIFMAVANVIGGVGAFALVADDNSHGNSYAWAIAGLATAVAAYVHWRRFHVPITVAAGFTAMAVTAIALLAGFIPGVLDQYSALIYLRLGLAAFGLAMWFDMSDRSRQTRRTDIAFWLHLLAAPLIVHPVVLNLTSENDMTIVNAGTILMLFVVLSAVALIVDRRALLVSSLSYLGYAAITLIASTRWESSAAALAVLAVGAVVLLLSVAWRPLRALLMGLVPQAIRIRVPHAV